MPPKIVPDWCTTCDHRHGMMVPVITYACQDCDFGSWRESNAMTHTMETNHAVRPVHHDHRHAW